jgi:2-polyprenyl-3-methyl-5-hydroxy-6-metoxy-1,4-benzoquinol methylase
MEKNPEQVLEQVKKLYNTIPYESYGTDFSVLLKSLRMDELSVHDFCRGKKALEVGCGAGHISLYLASLFEHVTSIDISEKSLEFAKQQALKSGALNISFEQANLFDPKVAERFNAQFDYVICYGVLHHTHDPAAGLKIISGFLKPGGIVTVGVYSRTLWKYRLQRKLVLMLAGQSWEKRERVARRLFAKKTRSVTVFDSFVHPQVSFHSIGEVMDWVKGPTLCYIGSWPPVEIGYYMKRIFSRVRQNSFMAKITAWYWLVELLWLLSGKSIMVNVSARKDK